MSLFKRVADLLDANINALIDKVEDPEVMLEKYILDMDEEYKETQAMVAKTIAARNITQSKYTQIEEQVDTWEKNAMLAVEKGNDDLAKKALLEKANHEKALVSMKPELDAQSIEVDNLKLLLTKLESKINEAKSRKEILVTKAVHAETKKKIAEFSTKMSGSDSVEGFSRMEEKVNEMAAEAAAIAELNGDSLEAQFEALKTANEDSSSDEMLAQLKARMGK